MMMIVINHLTQLNLSHVYYAIMMMIMIHHLTQLNLSQVYYAIRSTEHKNDILWGALEIGMVGNS